MSSSLDTGIKNEKALLYQFRDSIADLVEINSDGKAKADTSRASGSVAAHWDGRTPIAL